MADEQPKFDTLIAFRDGSYKRLSPVGWRHSQWLHFKLPDGTQVAVNPANVNYLHTGLAPEA